MRTFRVIGRFCSGAATVILYVASILVVLSAAALTATPMLACVLLIATIGCISFVRPYMRRILRTRPARATAQNSAERPVE